MSGSFSRRSFITSLLSSAVVASLPAAAWAGPSNLAVQAAKTALSGDFMTAGDMAKRSGDQAAVKIVEMIYLRDHGTEAGYARIMAFLEAAPTWPLQETLLKRAEKALYENAESPSVVQAHFASRKPATPYGAIALARMSFVSGDEAQGKKWLRKAWFDADVEPDLETKISNEFSGKLSQSDFNNRMWRLIFAQETSSALRFSRKLGPSMQRAAEVAKALIAFNPGAERQFMGLPASTRNELAMLYALARFYRKNEQFSKARTILASLPADPAALGDATAWFEERRTIIRRSLGPNNSAHWKTAYTLAKNHGVPSGDFAIDGEFLAGWVALRYLRDPETALTHFSRLTKLAKTGTDAARAHYWIGRAQKALGDGAAAKAAFRSSSDHSTIYYGQLAREQLGLGKTPEEITAGGTSQTAAARVEQDEVVRAFRIMSQAAAKNQLNIFLWSLANRFNRVDELNAVAQIVQNIAGTSWSLRFAKAVGIRGIDIDAWSYPVYGLPNWSTIGKPVEKPLVFALSRQESEFDPNAGSTVGAQGLMQLMPATARLVARQYRINFAAGRLKDPGYNVQLGAAHLADLVDDFSGSYVLTLVAYNAGPRRAREWVEAFGDPRGGQVDPIDWVECIPFNETRQYVQKVLQNLHVYRSRLAPGSVRPMTADLMRGTPSELNVASTTQAPLKPGCGTSPIGDLIGNCN